MSSQLPPNPMQPFVMIENGRLRFRQNAIVRYLLDFCRGKGCDLNTLAVMEFSQEDRCQFAQLIGYTLTGYHELSYVSDYHARAASAEARKEFPDAEGCRDQDCPIHSGIAREA